MEEEKNIEEQEEQLIDKLRKVVENELEQLIQNEIKVDNIGYLGQLIDMHKDLENEDYWKVKKEVYKMRYNDYGEGSYSDGGYGNYNGNYGRRGVPGSGRGRYRGPEDMLEKMHEQYGAYSESRSYGRGNYGGKEETMRSLDYMLQSVCQFMQMLEQDASSEEESQLIKKYARKISEM